MKGLYLAAYRAYHEGYDIDYQDINGKRDIGGDMLDVDLTKYDYFIATPPCNYWSKCNYRRNTSLYSLRTSLLLPTILRKLVTLNKPFIVENVRNEQMYSKYGLFDYPLFIYTIGRHTYWTNVFLNSLDVEQITDDVVHTSSSRRQGGENVHNVIEMFLETIGASLIKKENYEKN